MDIYEYLEKQRKIRELFKPIKVMDYTALNMYKLGLENPFKDILSASRMVTDIKFSPLYTLIDKSDFFKAERYFGDLSTLLGYEYQLDGQFEEVEEDQVIQVVNSTKIIIADIYKNEELLNTIDPTKFEEIIAEMLFKKGFEVNLTKQTRDGGYDILALSKIAGMPLKFLVECKRHRKDRPVGIDMIRSFCDVVKEENANKGMFFTTSYFSSEAKKRQLKVGTLLDLKERNDVLEWVRDYLNW
ncbi:restriction endonuclease [Fulvivirga ulvae]|uniref:restriction endonuclease n=1 Tax=Fulvivirga ulvae TaxID=2904245 RepID=UPI001F228BD3|nr:restriction endonuclease [Fulvivirga ulvae]UII32162.1 restriction endonuclease [Fulvivirga ulvae]